jgi:adenylate cyclase, class 2
MAGPIETEIKLRLSDPERITERLRLAGFRESVGRVFESNTLYDTPDMRLRSQGTMLRVREVGQGGLLTWKGPVNPGPYKSRPEVETSVGSAHALHQILSSLGFQPYFRYEKYRTEFKGQNSSGTVTWDETPIGDFLELEGGGEWIDQTARVLGFSSDDYILESYGRLYLAECQRQHVEPSNMIFAAGV